MSFNYSGNPATSPTDEVRFLLQDTDSANPIFQDEEIQWMVGVMGAVDGSIYRAAAYLAATAAARYAKEVTISSDQTSIAMEQLQQKYEQLASDLRAMAGVLDVGSGPIVGGLNWDDWFYGGKPKVFGLKIDDNIRAGDQSDRWDSPWYDYEQGGMWTW